MISISPSSYNFGTVDERTGPYSYTVTLNNDGAEEQESLITDVSCPSGFTCDLQIGQSISPGGSINFNIGLPAETAGNYSGTLNVSANIGGTGFITLDAIVNHVDLPASPQWSPDSLDFGSFEQNSGNVTRNITVTNNGEASYIGTVSPDSNHFTVSPDTFNIPGGGSQEFIVTMLDDTPIDLTGANFTALSFIVGEGSTGIRMEGKVTSLPPAITLSASSHAFNAFFTKIGSRSATIRISNNGSGDLNISNLTTTPNNVFSASLGNNTIAPGGHADLVISMSFATVGAFTATISFDTNDPLSPSLGIPVSGSVLPRPTPHQPRAAKNIVCKTGHVTRQIAWRKITATGNRPWRKSVNGEPQSWSAPDSVSAAYVPAITLCGQ